MAAIVAARVPSRETIGARLRRLAAAARYDNPVVNGAMPTPPAITVGTTAPAGLTNAYRLSTHPGLFREFGGVSTPFASTFRRYPVATLNGSGAGGNAVGARNAISFQVEATTDAAKVSWRVLGSPSPYRFLVQGPETGGRLLYVDRTGTVPAGSSGTQYLTLDFGARATRRLVIEGEFAQGIDGMHVGPTESVAPTSGSDILRAVVLSDSFGEGAGTSRAQDGVVPVLGRVLGIRDTRSSALGGTGWLNSVGGTKYTVGQRVSVDLIPQQPDVAFILAGINDAGQPAAGITSEVTVRIRELRASLPGVPVFVFGSWPQLSALPASVATENAIAAGVAAGGDPLSVFVPICTDAAGAWLFGTGKVGAANGTGNADLYVSSDGTHPSTAGHQHLGLRAADAVMSRLGVLP